MAARLPSLTSSRMYLKSVLLTVPPMVAFITLAESESASVPAVLSHTVSAPLPARLTSCKEPSASTEKMVKSCPMLEGMHTL